MPTREDQKQRVQQATDIVRLIGEQIALRPRGSEHVGLCPFHDDKSPSLYVSPVKQIYKCFSCGAGGDVFSFMVNYHKMTFPEALRHLAERAGIELDQPTAADRARGDQRQQIADANQKALDFFRQQLTHPDAGRSARHYIEQRGIHPDMVAAFQIGYAPDAWDALAQELRRRRWEAQGFLAAGLVAERGNRQAPTNERQSLYDRLRHRLIFPIFDAIGRPVAFGGRVLPGGTLEDPTRDAKYLNSPETVLFNKSATLYGIHRAKKPIIDSRTAVIVEGYTDVIACHQAAPGGAANVVATLGTALTAEHVRELRRYAEKVVLVFDADAAGQKAADRAVELFLAGELDVAIAILPEGLDPADLLAQEDGYERWCALVASAGDALDYQFRRIEEQLAASDSVTGRERITQGYVERLAQLGLLRTSPIRRAAVVQRLATLLRVNESAVNELLSRADRRQGSRRGPLEHAPPSSTRSAPTAPDEPPLDAAAADAAAAAENDASIPPVGEALEAGADNLSRDVAFAAREPKLKAIRAAERQLIGCLLRDNELFHQSVLDGRSLDEAIAPNQLITPAARRVYERVYEHLSEGERISLAPLLSELVADAAQDSSPRAAEAGHDGGEAGAMTDLVTDADAEVERATAGDAERLAELCARAAEALLHYHRQQDHLAAKRQWHSIDDEQEKARQAQRMLEGLRQPSPARIARPPG